MSIDIAGAGTDSQPLDLSFTRQYCRSGDCTACPQAVAAAETMAVTNASAAAASSDGEATTQALNQEEEYDEMPSVSSKLCRVYVMHTFLSKH